MNRENSIDWRVILIVCSIIVATQMGIRNCFGLSCVESGQSLEPEPPQIMTGITLFILIKRNFDI